MCCWSTYDTTLSCKGSEKVIMPKRFVSKDVIDYLDTCVIDEPYCFFMDLGHGYFYTANSRLTLYGDDGRWAIVFEKSGYANRDGRIELELNFRSSRVCVGSFRPSVAGL